MHSTVLFTVTHLGASRFTGRFDGIKGELTTDGTGAAPPAPTARHLAGVSAAEAFRRQFNPADTRRRSA